LKVTTMISDQNTETAMKPFGLNSGQGPHLQLLDVGEWYALIEPESMFWALVAKDRDLGQALREEVLPMYYQHAESMRKELHQFRFEERFSAVYFNPTGRCNANCRYCYLPDDLRDQGHHMTYEEVSLALDNLHEFFETYPG
jgi:uncharacterized protein